MNWTPLLTSLKLAFCTTSILLIIGVPLAYLLSRINRTWKVLIESILTLPLVLPPTVLGLYFLLVFSPDSVVGGFFEGIFGISFLFSFKGLVLGSVIYGIPFMIHPIYAAFKNYPKAQIEIASLLGATKWKTLVTIILPNSTAAILSGIVLTFAHALGEFGFVLMIGGNIPGETKVASIAIYDHVENLEYTKANTYAFALLFVSFFLLCLLYLINNNYLNFKKNR